jgi:hypothetical protein
MDPVLPGRQDHREKDLHTRQFNNVVAHFEPEAEAHHSTAVESVGEEGMDVDNEKKHSAVDLEPVSEEQRNQHVPSASTGRRPKMSV